MANENRPWGLKPVKSLIAGDYDGRGNVYHVPSTDSTMSYYVGDVVCIVPGGGTGDANGIPSVAKYIPGAASASSGVNGAGPVGVVVAVGTSPDGPWVDPSDLTKTYAPVTKTKDYYLLVADDPFLIFEVQEGGSGTAFTKDAIGLNANLSYTIAQATYYKQPALGIILEHLPATAELTFASLFVSLVVAVPMGVLSAVRRDTVWDYAGMFLATVGQATPVFWLGLMFILLLSVQWTVLPSSGPGAWRTSSCRR